MKRRTAWVLAAAVVVVAVGAAAVGVMALMLRGGSSGSGGGSGSSYLELRLEGDLPEQPPAADLEALFGRPPVSVRTLVESLDRAADDAKVTSVVIRLGVLSGTGWGKVQEIRDAIERFRRSGKPVYAHIEFCSNKEYYLATACSKIYVVPTAILDISGLAAEVTFFKKTLDKLGVEAQFESVGRYKNAPNQFTETAFTDAHREQTVALLDSLFGQYLQAIVTGRGKSEEEARALIDGGPYAARAAQSEGLVDELLYDDELDDRLESSRRLTPGRYTRESGGFGLDMRPKVALVYVVGEIVSGESQDGPFGGEGYAGSTTVARAIEDARKDDDIKAILLRVDSPGGSGTASDVIWREVTLAQQVKPVIVSMGDVAASGGYYVAMGGGGIVAQPGTITGSIGVFAGKFSLAGLYEKIGITKEIVSRGRNAALFTEYRPWTAEERERIRAIIEAFYGEFVGKAAEGRGKSYEELDAVAQGRVWTGEDALAQGLVDRLGGLEAAVALAKEKAQIAEDQDVRLVVLPEKKGLFEQLLERQEETGLDSRLTRELLTVYRWAAALHHGAPMARLPFDLSVR